MAERNEAPLGYVPHFDVTTLDGRRVRYDEIWQRRNLVLILVSSSQGEAAARYASLLDEHHNEFEEDEATVVVTTDAIPGLSTPTVLVADRWGEILYLEAPSADGVSRFPPIHELLSSVHFAAIQCPECPP